MRAWRHQEEVVSTLVQGGGCVWVKSCRGLGRVEVGSSQWMHSQGLSADPSLGVGQPG